jgi:hypothetical protein
MDHGIFVMGWGNAPETIADATATFHPVFLYYCQFRQNIAGEVTDTFCEAMGPRVTLDVCYAVFPAGAAIWELCVKTSALVLNSSICLASAAHETSYLQGVSENFRVDSPSIGLEI